jgi:hypothetical protein
MQHPRNRKLKALATGLVAAAFAAPVTHAAVDRDARHQALLDKAPQAQVDARHQSLLERGGNGTTVYVTKVASQSTSGGIDWGDAGIGAGTAVGVILLGAGGALVIRRRPAHA